MPPSDTARVSASSAAATRTANLLAKLFGSPSPAAARDFLAGKTVTKTQRKVCVRFGVVVWPIVGWVHQPACRPPTSQSTTKLPTANPTANPTALVVGNLSIGVLCELPKASGQSPWCACPPCVLYNNMNAGLMT